MKELEECCKKVEWEKDCDKIFWSQILNKNKINKDIEHIHYTANLLQNQPNISSIKLLRMEPESQIKLDIVENTNLYILCIDSTAMSEDQCCIWINGQNKKITAGTYLLFEPSKEHILYNDTYDDIHYLLVYFSKLK
jgi:hypothetical protein